MATKNKLNFAVMASGGGTNFQAMVDAGHRPCIVLTNNPDAYILERAKVAGIPSAVIDPNDDAQIVSILKEHGTELIFLAGYLRKISPAIINNFEIFNIHPAHDLHRFGGKGMYGVRVHEAVIASGEKASGATIHRVNEHYDEGAIIMQTPPVAIDKSDTPESLQKKVLKEEYKLVVRFLDEISPRNLSS